MNKDRVKRANVKKPRSKNPQAQIEIELAPEELVATNDATPERPKPGLRTSDDSSESKESDPIKKPISPSHLTQNKAANAEQPKVSINHLENVKLR